MELEPTTADNQSSAGLPCYDAVLFQNVFGREGERFSARLMTRVKLPFVPTKEIGIGLDDHSDFRYDEANVRRVMWHYPRREFHVEIEECRGGIDVAAILISLEGWMLDPGVWFQTREDADESAAECGGETVICLDGKWYTLTADEMWCLKLDGRSFLS